MNGPGHYALGASAGVVWAQVGHLSWWQALIAVPVAAGVSYGALSPDIDQSRLWRFADRVLPDEWLGKRGPMRHRGISHFWGVFAALTYLAWTMQPPAGWLVGAVLAGWWSHLLADVAVGASGQGRGPGIPVMPWWGHVGFGARCGGWAEATWAVVVPVLAVLFTVSNLSGTYDSWTLT